MTAPSTLPAHLLPCPFCGHDKPSFERMGTSGQSCIVVCGNCGCRHESSDEYEHSGSSWNDRAHPTPPLRQQACDAAASDNILESDGFKQIRALSDRVGHAMRTALPDAAASERKLLAQSLRDAIHEALSEAEGVAQNGSLAAQLASETAAEIWPLLDQLAASPAPAPHAGRETTGQDEKARRWVYLSDRMPEPLTEVLVLRWDGGRYVAWHNGAAWFTTCATMVPEGALLAWREMPHEAEDQQAIDTAMAATPGAKP